MQKMDGGGRGEKYKLLKVDLGTTFTTDTTAPKITNAARLRMGGQEIMKRSMRGAWVHQGWGIEAMPVGLDLCGEMEGVVWLIRSGGLER
jgi:hypothetical protein